MLFRLSRPVISSGRLYPTVPTLNHARFASTRSGRSSRSQAAKKEHEEQEQDTSETQSESVSLEKEQDDSSSSSGRSQKSMSPAIWDMGEGDFSFPSIRDLGFPSFRTGSSPFWRNDWFGALDSPFTDASRMMNMMNDLFAPPLSLLSAPVGQSIANQFNVKPGLDVDEDDDQLVLKFEVPGIPKDKLKVSLKGDVLTVRGHHVEESGSKEDENYRLSERSFRRSVRLPLERLDVDGFQSNLEHGILRITVPKSEEEKSDVREIQIT